MTVDSIIYGIVNIDMKEKIIVAVSGGVDSAVVAVKMKKEGYNVVAVMLKLYSGNSCSNRQCCGNDDIIDVQKLCGKFDIPYYVINQEDLFYKEVMVKFADSYISGETPVPCMHCNQKVKINTIISLAKKIGAKYIATGHYIRNVFEDGMNKVYRGIDLAKDQSYFLSTLKQDELNMLQFPLGNFTKSEVREMAKNFEIEIAQKKDSQDICFVGKQKYVEVIKKIKGNVEIEKNGEILDHKSNKILGHHNGAIGYTIGQRKGLGVSQKDPLYVTKIDVEKNIVYVSSDEDDLFSSKFNGFDVNFFDNIDFFLENDYIVINADVCLRALQSLIPCKIKLFLVDKVNKVDNLTTKGCFNNILEKKISISLDNPGRAITIGQYCVFYQKDRLIGSAKIG